VSYDVGVHCHTCGYDLTNGHGNMTSNVSGVWTKAGAPLRDWNDKTGVEVLPKLQGAIAALSDLLPYERKEYEQLVRGDGSWGTADSAREFLIVIRDAICRDPFAKLSVGH
jgi:hypothetical protein